jgi:hypothetical protein
MPAVPQARLFKSGLGNMVARYEPDLPMTINTQEQPRILETQIDA